KSQLNLGHLVDADKRKRGEGFELRSDGWGAIRGGKGVFISADEQPRATGMQLDMEDAINQLESALSLARSLASASRSAEAIPSDVESQRRLGEALKNLKRPGVLVHAPSGIGMVSPEAVCLASGAESVGIVAAHNADISAGRNFTAAAQDAVSVLARKADLQLKAAEGQIKLHAQKSDLHALAKADVKVESTSGRVEISAAQELVLYCGGAYIRLKDGEIELGAPGNIYLKALNVEKLDGTTLDTPATPLPAGYSGVYELRNQVQAAKPFSRYQVTTQQGDIFTGVTDKDGRTMSINTLVPGDLKLEMLDSLFDEQLRLVDPNGKPASNLNYRVTLADNSSFEGMTNEQGHTQRIVTREPARISRLSLFPPEGVKPICCAAQNAQAPLEIDLSAMNISTNDTGVGTSTKSVALPKGKTRGLTTGEVAMARSVFKDAVNYSKVKVHHGGWWLFFGFQNTAVTPNGEMYYPESTEYYRDDFSNTANDQDKALFMHEMTHVWQYQMGYPVKKNGLTVSSRGAEAYEYKLSSEGRFSEYNMEQQGEIVSDYYMICVVGDSRSVWNGNNATQSPKLLASTLADFLKNPADKTHLPTGRKV
ncbi:DUF2345 domain-containing protein, partial [Pseudomonas sp. SMN5]|uniref:DUF2345 domain-containing protein n=1 Tax=Pseudomonas sp. SMN5 TaxID=3390198 RepID=UPI003F870295